jgi:hypothetical protein
VHVLKACVCSQIACTIVKNVCIPKACAHSFHFIFFLVGVATLAYVFVELVSSD